MLSCWNKNNLGDVVEKFDSTLLQIDVWLLSASELIILGVKKAEKKVVEDIGIFTWEEIESGGIEGEVIVRALTGKMEMSSKISNVGVPSDFTGVIPGTLEDVQKLF